MSVVFTMTKRTDQRICINAPAHSIALVQAFFWAKHRIIQVCQHPYSPDLAPCDFLFIPKLNSPLKVTLVNATVVINGVSLPTDVAVSKFLRNVHTYQPMFMSQKTEVFTITTMLT
jgi:hypothetical protein